MNRDIRLLIVDDNVATRYALRRRLERHGYTVLEAGTGSDGLALIESEALDALILDVNLPDMSGFDIVRLLRADPRTALLPVIHVSAASIQTGDIITGLNAGADAYLIHPVDPDVLLATLRTLLRVRDTENALRESEARFREIFANVSAPIAVLDANLKVHECNHAFAQLIVDNRDPQALRECFAEDQCSILDELRLRLVDGERWKGTLNMRVQGEIRETQWQISPYRTPELSLVFVEDVTEHRHRERSHLARLDDTTTQLAKEVAERVHAEAQLLQVQKMDALGKLTGGIAHDFNNLLTGIITSLELIQKRVADERLDKVQFYTEAALNSAMSAASLTHRLLAFARQQPLDTRPVDINEHVRSLEELLVRTIGERITLKLELTNKPAIALVDPVQLESAVLNLVINARDALPSGGNIWVNTYAAYSHGDPNLADGAYVALSVRDDGTGIEHNVIDKVFEPFFTTKPLGQGTGLGLSTIYGFARQSGGDAHIRSVARRGTEVTIMLPGTNDPTGADAPVPVPDAKGSGEHVLIVEDMATVRLFVTEVLEDAGYRCTQAADIESALERLQNDPSIDLLLTDVGLPRMSGRELADVARGWHEGLPILFMTGYAETALNRQVFLGTGMDMLVKPFQISELLDKVRRTLDGA
ncbi:multi-sensor hybrid histidine kinase [Pseudomonas sp. B10]|jgi:PAS domain S-box-containing protein|uniref:histidine kinase n=2 Tax=Pseudomonas TaxID=286 RepID=A0AAU7F369_9PSED|nr:MULTISPECIES: response regulator [Pseudomonas]RON73881.1 hybrid sensor histidine kinase/response regulator [Pseudomonas fluorescens]MCW0921303.1 response regulator [Pseudomonas sp. RG1]MDH1260278.1 response regulator [Pseudomonas atacamensis]MDH2080448.1 response regulator [Pseudomonas atacamensis]MDT6921296.1 response regulator [Pseudomonas atacamensis]